MRQYLHDIDHIAPAFLEFIQFWWLIVNFKELHHTHPFGNAANSNIHLNVRAFIQQMSEWLKIWKCSGE